MSMGPPQRIDPTTCCTSSKRLTTELNLISSVAEHPFLVRWVIRSIPHGGSTELFLVQAMLHNSKRALAANQRVMLSEWSFTMSNAT